MAKAGFTLGELAEVLQARLEGDPARVVVGVAPLESAGPDQISFLTDPRYHGAARASRAGAFVAPADDPGSVTRLAAFVVAPGLSSEFILAELRRRIDAAFLPRPLCIVESLPRNATGKLPRAQLDSLAAKAG